MFRSKVLFWTFFLLLTSSTSAQYSPLNVRHLTTKNGLGDGVVRAIGQDKYGYLWIGTINGLNRFDGTKVRRYQSDPKNKNSIPPSIPRYILGDKSGNLWIGFNQGLYRYDFARESFFIESQTAGIAVSKVCESVDSKLLYLLTDTGILVYDPLNRQKTFLKTVINDNEFVFNRPDCKELEVRNNMLYTIHENNVYAVNLLTGRAEILNRKLMPAGPLQLLTTANDGTLYVSSNNPVISIRKIDPNCRESTEINLSPIAYGSTLNNKVISLYSDNKRRLWITTTSKWLFSKEDGKPIQWHAFHNLKKNTVSLMLTAPLFEARNGYFWLATEGYGVDYFHPDNNYFTAISPEENTNLVKHATWARAALEDKKGNIWMGWSGGLSKYNSSTDSYQVWQNFEGQPRKLHNNSIRSLAEDERGNIWIATAKGMNCLQTNSNKMLFFDEKDSLPIRFYWAVACDSRKDIWIGSGSGLYRVSAVNGEVASWKCIQGIKAAIDTGVRVIYEDRNKKLWFGLDGNGLVFFDPLTEQARKWKQTSKNDSTLFGNTITGITEEKNGVIWISSFNGLVSYDPRTDRFQQYGISDGLPGIKCAGILTDSLNRIWVATSGGLAVLEESRKHFTTFTAEDGLETIEFADMPATRKKNGHFLFPTMSDYIEFNPQQILAVHDSLNLYISAIKVFDKPYKAKINTEELHQLRFKSNENFFSFNLVALNYNNPNRTIYRYMLEGFDKDWITSTSGLAIYTNVPGGSYRFRFKASTEPEKWEVPEKIMFIKIDTVFYKSAWFWILFTNALLTLLYVWYRSRLKEQKNLFQLKSMAQNLEKEKALAMFEALKQQLNPHFLFNSLSSLGTLIRTDQKLAAGFLDNLSKIYRYILQSKENDLISVEKEIRFVSSYIRLLETRFQNGLRIEIDVAQQYLNKKIVPVTLQNLIDNAIKHNRMDEDSPLVIRIFANEQYLYIRNNIQRLQSVETSNRQGLKSLQSLYRYMTDLPILIEENNDNYQIKIPLI